MSINHIVRSAQKCCLALAAALCVSSVAAQQPADWPIITRDGDQLLENGKPFRFMGFAAPNIHQNETQLLADYTNRFPDEYEIRDILSALQRVGSRATRTFALSVYSPEDNGLPVYIQGHRDYNEEAFKALDRLLAYAPEYDVRIIIPLIASQQFPGWRGVDEFAALSGKGAGEFWTDPAVKKDFKHFLDFVTNRVNTVSGLRYKDDPALLAWQFGNEFTSYWLDRKLPEDEWQPKIEAWTVEMAAYLKSIDNNHLIMEGNGGRREVFIDDPNIDIISEHLYEYWNKWAGKPWQLAPLAEEVWQQTKGKKPLIIDEFGLGTTENIEALMQTIVDSGMTGGLMWSIRGHRRDGSWYYHNEGGTFVNSYHYPGFAAGRVYEEQRTLDLVKKYAYRIRQQPIPAKLAPSPAPVLFQQLDGFTWRGATGAAYYSIERASSEQGPWRVIATGLQDSIVEDVKNFEYTKAASEPLVLFYDVDVEPNQTLFYRVRGHNIAGASEYSQPLQVVWK
ncbi:hypothetical protein GCM10011369_13050 [Neiella marina]|uniref:mannan endo-1,4-beta-mannosidase n=1 Tax=Neiella marina TaxID=508461 RepID=A0A8J2U425_9GAMM|nr:cellulase family glycosylhydrolase [Neiella marina]GGA72672.1 hypothetical protein GCM10011369_13050 [Neiella marina]